MSLIQNVNYFVSESSDPNTGYFCDVGYTWEWEYKYCYYDITGAISKVITLPLIKQQNVSSITQQYSVVLYYIPTVYDSVSESLKVYRRANYIDDNGNIVNGQNTFTLLDEIEPEDEGVILDSPDFNNLIIADDGVSEESLDEHITSYNYKDGMMWSLSYTPSWIKEENFIEVHPGDGSQITGLETMAGNLVVFKESSIHRYAVLGNDYPLSRPDDISLEFGCIAPNTLINLNDTLYFLSWKGFCVFDNNQPRKIDVTFSEELQYILHTIPLEYIREASATYNPYYNEIWLNMPWLESWEKDKPFEGSGFINENGADVYKYHNNTLVPNSRVLGHIYVINLDKGYTSKYAYPMTRKSPFLSPLNDIDNTTIWAIKRINDVRQNIRLYKLNSLGELRSADILPIEYGSNPSLSSNGYKVALCYKEVPDQNKQNAEDDVPYILSATNNCGRIIYNDLSSFGYTGEVAPNGTTINTNSESWFQNYTLTGTDGTTKSIRIDKFPMTIKIPIITVWKSKFFTGGDENLIKRVRKVFANIFSWGKIKITSKSKNEGNFDDRIGQSPRLINQGMDNEYYEEFNFPPTVPYPDNESSVVPTLFTNQNVLSFVPTIKEPYDLTNTNVDFRWSSSNGISNFDLKNSYQDIQSLNVIEHEVDKPIRYSIEIYSYGRTVISGITINWRPITSYLR